VIAAIRWLVADTFRQSRWSGVFWLMLSVSGLCILFALGVGFTKLGADEASVRSVQFLLTGLGANTIGILLALTFAAGFIPAFTDATSALILLAKPTPRWVMFAGKFLGVLTFFSMHAAIFVVGTWVAFGISTGFWPLPYLESLPVLILNFTAFYSFSALLAVMTRNMVACVIGSIAFWLLCAMMNVGRHALIAYDLEQFGAASRFLSEAGYWFFPKPLDTLAVLHDALISQPLAARFEDFGRVENGGSFRPLLSMATSLLFPMLVIPLAAYELETIVY
jgi:ABC-type transport system involved in multi-copper enzyme maturation permease subunit